MFLRFTFIKMIFLFYIMTNDSLANILKENKTYVNKITADGNYSLVLPFKENGVFDIRELDQLVENLKTNLSEPQVFVIPSNKENYYDIFVKTERKKMLDASITLDNNNYKDYGRENLYLNLGRDHIFSGGDYVSISMKERLTKNRKEHRESLYSISYAIPIRNWKASYSFSHEKTKNKILSSKSESRKIENSHNIEFSKVLYRNATKKIDFFFGFNLKDTKNYFNEIKLEVSSKRRNKIFLGSRMYYYFNNAMLYLEPSIERGVRFLGGEGDKNRNQASFPFDKEFKKYNMNIYLNKSFSPTNYGYFNYTANISTSYTSDHLLDANKFEMGGLNSVRGFKESTIKGDKGIYMSNTFSFEREGISPFIGFDFGLSRDYYRKEGDKLIGAAIGIKFKKSNILATVTFSKALKYAQDMPRENPPIYFKILYSF
ncbi:ShlB/FhaC/HecB family hemolysin secretion/activation protein [Fusobacterium necrophorum]|uniref:ShlB/FhaC/HecB family hemolysin secretion/activation protein n=1 Tax=Fusobacterium necrophorum TaxID=859 RepID=A0A4Q2KY55_9FUSO|nr:ShlB/FhaC/HecB family hemolysin secretion/activation protein [Fusobacterium necrophorum]RXZ69520.1 ShlB/FhaC/HecB family hemolysin secretion/activation protein [Fusobacterium necrophorum]